MRCSSVAGRNSLAGPSATGHLAVVRSSGRAVAVALALAFLMVKSAAAAGPWLDEPLQPWNLPGGAVPSAPPQDVKFQAPCTRQERGPATPEEMQLAAAGWRLEAYWPAQRQAAAALIVATSNYDGMCRPWLFNVFAFVDGHYAGTLSPAPMNSRTDGVLRSTPGPGFLADGRMEALFTRYATTDPLCCPSLGASRVSYRVERASGGPVVVAERVEAVASQQLPATGDPLVVGPALAPAAALLLGLGFLFRRRARRASS